MYFQRTIHRSQNLVDFLPLSMPFCALAQIGMGREKINFDTEYPIRPLYSSLDKAYTNDYWLFFT